MFYHWLAPLGKTYIIFNLFNYISFRAAGATVVFDVNERLRIGERSKR